jgi:hypothetical protein
MGKKIISPFTGVVEGYKQMNDAWNARIEDEKQKSVEQLANEKVGAEREAVAEKFDADPSGQMKTFGKAVQGQKFGTDMLKAS